MSTKPTTTVAWATDTNYPADAAPEASTPTKVAYPVGQVAIGHRPDDTVDATEDNDWRHKVGNAIEWLAPADQERNDALIQLIPNLQGGALLANPTMPGYDVSTCPFVLALTVGAGFPRQGSANNKIRMSKGTLLQAPASGVIYAYTLDETEAEITIADAAGATPRVDLIEVKIEPDTSGTILKRNKITVNVVQGTPNASPTVPELTAGYVAYATVLVGASYAHAAGFKVDDTTGAVAVLHDQRLPLGVREFVVDGHSMQFVDITEDAGSGWTPSNLEAQIVGGSATPSQALARPPCGPTAGRLCAASLYMFQPAAPTMTWTFVREKYDSSGTNTREGRNGTTTSISAGVSRVSTNMGDLDQTHMPDGGFGPTIQPSSAAVGAPLWSNGHRAWQDFDIVNNEETSLAMFFNTNKTNERLYRAHFWIAGR